MCIEFNYPLVYTETTDKSDIGIGVIVDTETTGFSPATSEVIELGLLAFTYDKVDGIIYGVSDRINFLIQPSQPIPAKITELTGITDDMVKGHRWGAEQIEITRNFLAKCDFIIAHNAKFDRPFVEGLIPTKGYIPWVCSLNDIPWKKLGMSYASIEYLSLKMGYHFNGHRAVDDCHMTLDILSQRDSDSKSYFKYLLDIIKNANIYLVYAWSTPFGKKGKLKSRGYGWKASNKVWYRLYNTEEEALTEKQWLADNKITSLAKCEKVDLKERF